LHTDIIGNPANYPQVWKDALAGGGSIAGTPLLVGENGEDYIPSTFNAGQVHGCYIFKLSKKFTSGCGNYTFNGTNWDVKPTYGYQEAGLNNQCWSADSLNYDSFYTTNNVYIWELDINDETLGVKLVSYQAYNNNLAPIINSRVIGGSAGVSDVYASNGFHIEFGVSLGTSLVNKVQTQAAINNVASQKVLCVDNIDYYGNRDTPALRMSAFTNTGFPYHDTINLYGSTSPAVKTFSYLTQNTRAKQVYVFKEMKFNSDWGDDNKFNIVDNVDTVVDDNGSTVLVGQKARLIDGRIKE
jgi:hypothetical protein